MKKIIFILLITTLLFSSTKNVTLQLEWKHQFEYAGFYAAIEKGYYKDIGLHVEIKEFKDGIDLSDEITRGDSEFGVSSSSLILDKLNNKAVVLLASYLKQNALVLATKSNITKLSDLKNKKIMALPYELDHTSLGVMLNENGLDKTNYTLINHDFKVDKLLNGEVDAMSIFITNQTYELDKNKFNYNIFNPSDFGIYSYDVELFTSEKFAKEHPVLVKNFISATNKGWKYAFENKHEIINLIYNKYSKVKSKAALLYEADMIHKLFKTNIFKIGVVVPELVELNTIIYRKLNLINKNTNIKRVLSNYIFDYKNTTSINFTKKEQDFINNNPILKIGNDSYWPPFDFYEDGEAKGFNVDYMKEISKITGFEFKFVQDKNWKSLTKQLENKTIDILVALDPTNENKKFALFSDDILVTFESMITRESFKDKPKSYKDLFHKKVGIIKGYDFEYEIKKNYKQINMVLFDTPLDALDALSNGKIDVFIENTSVALYLSKKHFLSNLHIGVAPDFPNLVKGDHISIVSHIDNPELHSIIQKAIKKIGSKKKNDLQEKWMSKINLLTTRPINFTQEELNYINNSKILKIANQMDWAPFDYNELGKPDGLSIDYIKLILNKAGLQYKFINGFTWAEILEKFKQKEIDILPAFYKNKDREKYTLFTTAYYKSEFIFYSQFNDLTNKTIGIEKSDASIKIIKKIFPNSKIVELSTNPMLINQLYTKKIDAVVSNPLVLNYYNKKNNNRLNKIHNINITTQEQENMSLYLGIQKDKKLLHSIIQKTINSLNTKEINQLKIKWFNTNTNYNNNIKFTNDEINYLNHKKKITMCIDPNWMPYERFKDKKHIGMTADYFKIFQNNINIPIEIVPTKTWSESIEFAKQRKCDILSLAMTTPSRKEYMNFTSPYLRIPLVLATKNDVAFISDIQSIGNKKIGIPKGYAFVEILRDRYKNLNIIEVENSEHGLNMVREGKLFGYIGTLASVGYLFQKKFIGELKIAGKFEDNWELGVAVRNDEKILLDIFEKLVNSIDEETNRKLLNKWISIKYEKGTDYSLVYKIILITFIFLIIILFWNRKLNILNKKLQIAKKKAEEATKTKANFLANMSHEIRTPMNSIVSMSYLIGESNLDDMQNKYIQSIQNASNNLLQLLNDILDYSKMEVSMLELNNVNFSLLEVLNNVSNIAQVKADEKELKFSITYDKEMNTKLIGDEQRLSQILTNLLSNAIKFTKHGKVELCVTQISNKVFRFEVKDTGIGIESKYITHVFDSFTQADSGTTRRYGGTGLGLSISKELVKLMGGKIWVESTLNKGSTFSFEVTLKRNKERSIELQAPDLKANILKSNSKILNDNMLMALKEAVSSRRPQLCKPIIEEIWQCSLSNDEELFFKKLQELINKYKFKEAKDLLNEK